MIENYICNLCGQPFEDSDLEGPFYYGPNNQHYYRSPCCHSSDYDMVLSEFNADGPTMTASDEAEEEMLLVHGDGYHE